MRSEAEGLGRFSRAAGVITLPTSPALPLPTPCGVLVCIPAHTGTVLNSPPLANSNPSNIEPHYRSSAPVIKFLYPRLVPGVSLWHPPFCAPAVLPVHGQFLRVSPLVSSRPPAQAMASRPPRLRQRLYLLLGISYLSPISRNPSSRQLSARPQRQN